MEQARRLPFASRMTFRGRLRVFFAIIVIVPMVAIGLALLSLTASSERGKTDAGLATALTVAFSAYDDGPPGGPRRSCAGWRATPS